ncbi:hypothetical protein RJT34_07647 [Clitoria ternatea]|uniref:Uncharacterized protein n=1 Tax=Clitoria ternatea TaxID=43366 RepID=A0AAN9PSB7_CLITE
MQSTKNTLSGTFSTPQRSASFAALLIGDPTIMRDREGNFVLPRADVMKFRDPLRNEELVLEEAINTEWVYMWDKFGDYLLLLLGLTSKAERVQDEVHLRLYLDNIGFSDLTAKKIKKWMLEDHRQFEII